MSSCNVQHLCISLLSIDAINFDNAEVVALKPEILSSKGGHVDDTNHVGLSRLDMNFEVLGIIHQSSLWNWFRPGGVSDADKG